MRGGKIIQGECVPEKAVGRDCIIQECQQLRGGGRVKVTKETKTRRTMSSPVTGKEKLRVSRTLPKDKCSSDIKAMAVF